MLTDDTLTPRAYLQQARIEAGYASRDIAAAVVHFSPDAIGRHERGDVGLSPADVMRYAQAYKRDDVIMHYCAQCPAGKALGRTVALRPLPLATLRISARLRRAAAVADRLEAIADDGIIATSEHGEFDLAFAFLRTLESTIADYRLWAASNGFQGAKRLGGEDGAKRPATAVPGARSVTGAEGKGRPVAAGRPLQESDGEPDASRGASPVL